MTLDNYKVVLYRNQPDGWVAEVPAISGCYALMPTREEALAEVARVLGKMESTACEYLCCFIHQERPDGIDAWVDRATQERIAAAARVHGSQRLKPVFLALNQEVPYDAIRVTLTYLNTRSGLSE